MNVIRRLSSISPSSVIYRNFSVTLPNGGNHSCKVLVIGGGSGGCTMAAKFSRRLKQDEVIILEPSPDHYYQPLWTLVGAGIKTVRDTHREAALVLPTNAKWLKDKAQAIDPIQQKVTTECGAVINYEYVIISVGLNIDFGKIPGFTEALQMKGSGVSTIFSQDYCENTWRDMRDFKGGEAIFTFPDTAIKCPGAPQKIAYLADSHFERSGVRSKTRIQYNSCLPVIFGVKKYADALMKVVERKKIKVNFKHVLKRIDPVKKEAVFARLCGDESSEVTMGYDMLHVGPPMAVPSFLSRNKELTDSNGFLLVDKYTLQSTKYPNVFGIGDCTNTPNSKTAAAIAKQSYVVEHNLLSLMKKNSPGQRYDGYGACPLVTSYNTCILAEFLYDGVVHETFPFDQVHLSQESRFSYYMKQELFPFVYWNLMLKGYYHGPEMVRKFFRPIVKFSEALQMKTKNP